MTNLQEKSTDVKNKNSHLSFCPSQPICELRFIRLHRNGIVTVNVRVTAVHGASWKRRSHWLYSLKPSRTKSSQSSAFSGSIKMSIMEKWSMQKINMQQTEKERKQEGYIRQRLCLNVLKEKSFCQGDLSIQQMWMVIFAIISLFIRRQCDAWWLFAFWLLLFKTSSATKERKSYNWHEGHFMCMWEESMSYLSFVASAGCLPFCIQHEYLHPVWQNHGSHLLYETFINTACGIFLLTLVTWRVIPVRFHIAAIDNY